MTAGPEVSQAGADSAGVRVFPPALYLVCVAIGFVLQWLLPVPLLPADARLPLRVAGAVLIALWLTLSIGAVTTFRRAGTTPNPTRPTTALTFGGPYRFTRNPMYLGLTLMMIGVALLADALWPLVMVLPALIVVRRAVIDREERYLERKFGEEYLSYKRKVRRWL